MPKGKMIVWSNPASAEREAEYNKWYDSVHVPDVLKIDGIEAASRFKAADPSQTPGQYVAVYDVNGDFGEIMAGLGKAFTDGSMEMSDCIAPGPLFFVEEVMPETR